MTTVTSPPPMPRADGVATQGAQGMFFTFGRTSFRGLDLMFLMLCAYFFIAIGAVDQEWAIVAKFRPRLLLGTAILFAATVRILRGAATSDRGIGPPDAVSTWWGAYAIVTVFAVIWAYDFPLAKDEFLAHRLNALLCYPLIVALVRTRRELLVLVLVFCAAYGFYLLRSYTEFLNGRYDVAMDVKRMVGAGDVDPNSFAAGVVFSLPLLVWTGMWTRSIVLKLCLVGYGLLSCVAIVLTRSRSGLLLLAMTALWLLFVLPGRRMRAFGIVLLIVAGAIASTTLSDDAIRRYKGMFTGGSTQSEIESTEGRIQGYTVAWEIFRRRPILGVGPGNWHLWRMRKVDGSTLLPHNLPGQVIATLGVFGALTFGGFVLASLFRGVRERWKRREATDAWDRAVRSLLGAMMFTLFLLLVSGLAAHNLGRWPWCWAPAFIVVAATCRTSEGKGTA